MVEVQRGPDPGGVGGAYRAFGETLRGLKTTMARLIEGPMTIQYPEEKTPVYPRFRGRHKLHKFEDTGLEKCVGCSLCAAACPADCIRVVAAENIPGERVSAGERYAAVYEINLSRCIFCGYCEIACPFDAITMGHDYEMADYDRSRPDLHQGDAARRADRADAAEKRGRVSGGLLRVRPDEHGVGDELDLVCRHAHAAGVVPDSLRAGPGRCRPCRARRRPRGRRSCGSSGCRPTSPRRRCDATSPRPPEAPPAFSSRSVAESHRCPFDLRSRRLDLQTIQPLRRGAVNAYGRSR